MRGTRGEMRGMREKNEGKRGGRMNEEKEEGITLSHLLISFTGMFI
jgi:hypothetical protein